MDQAPKDRDVSLEVPFLRSCKQECAEPIQGEVKGEIPTWLCGSLIRDGGGLREVGPDKYNHIFDDLALLHNFTLRDGQVTYRNRFLRSDAYRRNMQANRIIISEFGTKGQPDPCKTIFHRLASFFSSDETTDNDMVNVFPYTDEVYACTETNFIWRIDPKTLETCEKVNLSKFVAMHTATAHPHVDTDGTVYNVGNYFTYNGGYVIAKFPPKKDKNATSFQDGSIVCRIPSRHHFTRSYFHSFGMSENYFVFVEFPLEISLLSLQFSGRTYDEAMTWYPEKKALLHVVRRKDGFVLPTRYVSNAFFVFHHINAYEEDDHLVVDLCGFENGEIMKDLFAKALEDSYINSKKLPESNKARPLRFVLPLNVSNKDIKENLVQLKDTEATAVRQNDGSILLTSENLMGKEPFGTELPRINYEVYNTKKYRYMYSVAYKERMTWSHLVKVDVVNKTSVYWNEEGVIPSEPVFIPTPNATEEDDGVLLSALLYSTNEQQVSLLVLDAKTMTELGRTTFAAPGAIPGDFHGIFIKDS